MSYFSEDYAKMYPPPLVRDVYGIRSRPRQMEWGDLYAGTGIGAFDAHRKAAVGWLFAAIRDYVKNKAESAPSDAVITAPTARGSLPNSLASNPQGKL